MWKSTFLTGHFLRSWGLLLVERRLRFFSILPSPFSVRTPRHFSGALHSTIFTFSQFSHFLTSMVSLCFVTRAGPSHDSNSQLRLKTTLFDESWVTNSIFYWIGSFFHATFHVFTQPSMLGCVIYSIWIKFIKDLIQKLNRINGIDWVAIGRFESRVAKYQIYWIGPALFVT